MPKVTKFRIPVKKPEWPFPTVRLGVTPPEQTTKKTSKKKKGAKSG